MQTTLDYIHHPLPSYMYVFWPFARLIRLLFFDNNTKAKSKNKHIFPSGKRLQDYMLPLPLVTQKNWFMFFFFSLFFCFVSSRLAQQRSVSGWALLCVRNVRSSQDLAALWDYSAEQEKHERTSLPSDEQQTSTFVFQRQFPEDDFLASSPFPPVSRRFLCCCFAALQNFKYGKWWWSQCPHLGLIHGSSATVVGHGGADPGKTETSLLLRPWQFKGTLWTLLQHIKLYLHPLLSNKTHCLYSWGHFFPRKTSAELFLWTYFERVVVYIHVY